MIVTLDVKNSSVFNLLRDLAALDFIRLDSPIPDADSLSTGALEDCPLCAEYSEPNEETIAAFEEGDAMLRGERPAHWHHSLDDLDKILGW
jgi:hypothetical protein